MTAEQSVTMTMRLFTASKTGFEQQDLLKNVLVPCIFGFIWLTIFAISYNKAGEYGAPPSLFYIQE
jgi:hypothetical protein